MDQEIPSFPIESISDEDQLFYRIHKSHLQKNVSDGQNIIAPGAFKELGEGEAKGMSCDWSKYATAKDCQNRPTETYPDGNREKTHGVAQLLVRLVREITGLSVTHHPFPHNRAHSHIKGIPPNKSLLGNFILQSCSLLWKYSSK